MKNKIIVLLFMIYISITFNSCNEKGFCRTKFTGFSINSQTKVISNNCYFEIILTRITLRGQKSCDISNAVMGHKISSISIKTIYEYSEDFLSGSDITHLFKSNVETNEFFTIDELINIANNDIERFSRFILFLDDEIGKEGKQRMKYEIRILLSDGKELVNQTDDFLNE